MNKKLSKRKLPLKPKRVVIKVGSQLLVDPNGFRHLFMRKLAQQIAQLRAQGLQCLLVSSGAIACGKRYLRGKKIALTLPEKQASAAIGQSRLIQTYEKVFARHDILTAQILLTRGDLEEEQRGLNIKHTLNCIIKHKILPIINENDTVSVDEISFSDNDILASLIAKHVEADLLIILSSVEGLLDQQHQRVSVANIANKEIWNLVRNDKSALGTGGMQSKLIAAKTLGEIGKMTVVANGNAPEVLLKIVNQQDIGTLFLTR